MAGRPIGQGLAGAQAVASERLGLGRRRQGLEPIPRRDRLVQECARQHGRPNLAAPRLHCPCRWRPLQNRPPARPRPFIALLASICKAPGSCSRLPPRQQARCACAGRGGACKRALPVLALSRWQGAAGVGPQAYAWLPAGGAWPPAKAPCLPRPLTRDPGTVQCMPQGGAVPRAPRLPPAAAPPPPLGHTLCCSPPCARQPACRMLLLFESAAGFCLFKVLNEGKLKEADTQDVWADFETPEKASKVRLHTGANSCSASRANSCRCACTGHAAWPPPVAGWGPRLQLAPPCVGSPGRRLVLLPISVPVHPPRAARRW